MLNWARLMGIIQKLFAPKGATLPSVVSLDTDTTPPKQAAKQLLLALSATIAIIKTMPKYKHELFKKPVESVDGFKAEADSLIEALETFIKEKDHEMGNISQEGAQHVKGVNVYIDVRNEYHKFKKLTSADLRKELFGEKTLLALGQVYIKAQDRETMATRIELGEHVVNALIALTDALKKADNNSRLSVIKGPLREPLETSIHAYTAYYKKLKKQLDKEYRELKVGHIDAFVQVRSKIFQETASGKNGEQRGSVLPEVWPSIDLLNEMYKGFN